MNSQSMQLDAQPKVITPLPSPESSAQPEESGPKCDYSLREDRANPINLDDFDEDDGKQNQEGTSEDEPLDLDKENFVFGTEFGKVAEYGHCLDNCVNPWNIGLRRPLYPSQIIGFNWMLDRHSHGGGLVADKVGCGKVVSILGKI